MSRVEASVAAGWTCGSGAGWGCAREADGMRPARLSFTVIVSSWMGWDWATAPVGSQMTKLVLTDNVFLSNCPVENSSKSFPR